MDKIIFGINLFPDSGIYNYEEKKSSNRRKRYDYPQKFDSLYEKYRWLQTYLDVGITNEQINYFHVHYTFFTSFSQESRYKLAEYIVSFAFEEYYTDKVTENNKHVKGTYTLWDKIMSRAKRSESNRLQALRSRKRKKNVSDALQKENQTLKKKLKKKQKIIDELKKKDSLREKKLLKTKQKNKRLKQELYTESLELKSLKLSIVDFKNQFGYVEKYKTNAEVKEEYDSDSSCYFSPGVDDAPNDYYLRDNKDVTEFCNFIEHNQASCSLIETVFSPNMVTQLYDSQKNNEQNIKLF